MVLRAFPVVSSFVLVAVDVVGGGVGGGGSVVVIAIAVEVGILAVIVTLVVLVALCRPERQAGTCTMPCSKPAPSRETLRRQRGS